MHQIIVTRLAPSPSVSFDKDPVTYLLEISFLNGPRELLDGILAIESDCNDVIIR